MMQVQALNGYGRLGLARVRPDIVRAPAMESLLAMQNRVFCLCRGFIGNSTDALDLTQDTLAKALEHYRRDDPASMQAWIMRIARNLCLDHLRRRKVRGPQHPIYENSAVCWRTPEDDAGAEEEIRVVRRAIALLPKRLRDVLVMREYGELTCQEIAESLGIGQATVSKRLKRARQDVLRHYKEELQMKKTSARGKP